MKAAILGMGAMGQVHKQAYEAAGVEVVATYDPKQDGRYRGCKRIHKKADGYGMAAQTIKDADIVSICSTDDVHAAQVIQALDMNKHVFCEKPLCHTRREFEAIKAAYEPKKRRCALGMNFPLRWHKPFVEAKLRILRGELGDIYLVQAEYNYGRRHKMTDGWRGKYPDYSVVMGGGIHLLDIMDWLGVPAAVGRSFSPTRDPWLRRCRGALKDHGTFKMTCDFTGDGDHFRHLRICGTSDNLTIDDREPTDKGRALREFLYCRIKGYDDESSAIESVPSPADIFRVHEIGLSL